MTYKHHALVQAWLDSKPVQYLLDNTWVDLQLPHMVDKLPHFYVNKSYRLKPLENRTRVAMTKSGTKTVNTLEQEFYIKNSKEFLYFVTNWTSQNE